MGVVVVTGAFGTLGRAVVTELVDRGYQVAGIDISSTQEETNANLTLGGVDLADEQAVINACNEVVKQLGGIDALVNVAGGFTWEPIETGSISSWDNMYRINIRTAIASCRAALPFLMKSRGAIVNVGAASSNQPGSGMAPYAASKSGVRALTESLAEEMRGRIRVNAIAPTTLDTPANRASMPGADTSGWVRPESAAKVIAFLVSDESGAITGVSVPLSLGGG